MSLVAQGALARSIEGGPRRAAVPLVPDPVVVWLAISTLRQLPPALALDLEAGRRIGVHVLVLLDAPVPTAAREHLACLTAREREVAGLVAEGRRNAKIATALGISLGTVKDHVHHALRKLGLRSRAALAAAITRPR